MSRRPSKGAPVPTVISPAMSLATPVHGASATPPYALHSLLQTPVRAELRHLLLPAFSLPQLEEKKRKKRARDAAFLLDLAEKPPYSYATLIGMAILTHPHKQLTLLQIYTWISQTFKYYRREDVGWQNLIRHNLSLNKAFVKGAKLKDGKGHFWSIKPECEDSFLKAKNKKSLYHEVMHQLALARLPLLPPMEHQDQAREEMQRQLEGNHEPPAKRARPQTPKPEAPAKLPFALSFSCSLTLELSPAQLELGPLLEPLTPRCTVLPVLRFSPGSPRKVRTPARTPQALKPLALAVARKLWHLPLYLEEFYHLPFAGGRAVLRSYDDDDMLMRVFESPSVPRRRETTDIDEP